MIVFVIFLPAFLLLPIFMQKVISNKNLAHMMLPVGVHELLIAADKHTVFKDWPVSDKADPILLFPVLRLLIL